MLGRLETIKKQLNELDLSKTERDYVSNNCNLFPEISSAETIEHYMEQLIIKDIFDLRDALNDLCWLRDILKKYLLGTTRPFSDLEDALTKNEELKDLIGAIIGGYEVKYTTDYEGCIENYYLVDEKNYDFEYELTSYQAEVLIHDLEVSDTEKEY